MDSTPSPSHLGETDEPAPQPEGSLGQPWRFLRDFWDHPLGKWTTGISTVAAVVVAVAFTVPSAPTSAPAPSAPLITTSASPGADPLVGDCLRHDGRIEVETTASAYAPQSRPQGSLSGLAIVDCTTPHELEVFPADTGTSAYCGQDAVQRSIGTWSWSTRLIGGTISPGLCAVGLRAGTRLQTVEKTFTDEPEPMIDFGACSSGLPDHAYESVPGLYLPCKPGRYLHYTVYAVTADVAEAVCEGYATTDHVGQSWGRTAPTETDGTFRMDCLYELTDPTQE